MKRRLLIAEPHNRPRLEQPVSRKDGRAGEGRKQIYFRMLSVSRQQQFRSLSRGSGQQFLRRFLGNLGSEIKERLGHITVWRVGASTEVALSISLMFYHRCCIHGNGLTASSYCLVRTPNRYLLRVCTLPETKSFGHPGWTCKPHDFLGMGLEQQFWQI